ncbi:MAG: hypothetical protein E7387_06220 [Ruminococcaceae bacterium]|nr:hypothetical protein [Oscillospiraceae bacterium]
MIDVAKEVSAFSPIDLTRIPENYKPATEQMRTSFILYNKALHEIHLGHDDVAKNFLRKAVAIFPDFYEALMVLGVLVFSGGDRIGAVRIFNSVKDMGRRADSIALLDHLVEEAEKPENLKRSQGKVQRPGQDKKAANVMGDRQEMPVSRPKEAKYSQGRVFERSSGYYEPQMQRRTSTSASPNTRLSYNRAQRSSEQIPQNEERQPKEAVLFKNQAKEIHDVGLLNKYLLIIVGILLVFLIVLSAMLVNRNSEVKELREKLEKVQINNIDYEELLR